MKAALIICLFAVFSCKKAATNNANNNNTTTTSHQASNCRLATYKNYYAKYLFYYNSANNLIGCSRYDVTGKTLQDSLVFHYNSAGQFVLISRCIPNFNISQNIASFSYNHAGMLIKDTIYADSIPFDLYDNYSYRPSVQSDKVTGQNVYVDSSFSFLSGMSNFVSATLLAYSADSNITDVKAYAGDGSLKYHLTFGYDNEKSFQNNLPLAFRIFFNSWNADFYYFYGVVGANNAWDAGFSSDHNNIASVNVSGNGTFGLANQTNTYTYNSEGLPVTEKSISPGLAVQYSTFTYNCH